jgi:PKD repeat protein
MKQFFLILALFTTVSFSFGQGIERSMVVIEKGSGTWCVFCPGAALGCEDLLEYGAPVAVISNQNGDAYANQYSNARNSMYQISGYPTTIFDGTDRHVGGNATGSIVGQLAPYVESHMADVVPVEIDIEYEATDDDYTATITLTKLDEITASDLRLLFFVTESEIPQIWFIMTQLDHVNRLMVPDQNGTTVDFSSGDVQTVELNFSLNPSWVTEHCEFVVALQNADAGQGAGKYAILNGIKRGAIDLTGDFEADVTSIDIGDQVNFTSTHDGGYVGPVPVTYHWEFPGATPDTSNEENPSVSYTEVGYHDVIFVVNRGGQELEVVKEDYIYVAPGVGIEDPEAVLAVNCYPNPTVGTFTLEVYPGNEASFDLQIVDTRNVVMMQESNIRSLGKWTKQITPDLASGVYFVVIKTGTQKQIRKLVIL